MIEAATKWHSIYTLYQSLHLGHIHLQAFFPRDVFQSLFDAQKAQNEAHVARWLEEKTRLRPRENSIPEVSDPSTSEKTHERTHTLRHCPDPNSPTRRSNATVFFLFRKKSGRRRP